MSRFRIGIVGLLQESNTFVKDQTQLDHFSQDLLLVGEDIRTRLADAPHEIGGFFEGLETAGVEPVPIFVARAVPYGVVAAEVFNRLVETMIAELKAAGPLDGLLAAPHGATVAENHSDADGYWLSEVRRVLGPEKPIVATLDLHANLSAKMVAATDALISYATNPHLDQRATGLRATLLMARILRGDVKPTQAAAYPPLAINIQSQNTNEQPLTDLYSWVDSVSDEVLNVSVTLGFPYADVEEMGSAVVVTTDEDLERAKMLAAKIGNQMYLRRHRFEPRFTSPLLAVKKAALADETPVVLLDMGDNVGGGAPGNGTALLHEVRLHGAGPAFACIADERSVDRAAHAGVGNVLEEIAIGDLEKPFIGDFRVVSLYEGQFSEVESRHGGYRDFDQGPTAVLESTDGALTVMLTTLRVPPFSLRQMTAFGLDPAAFRIIIAKGVIAPRAAFAPVARGGFIPVDTPGPTRADMRRLEYKNRRRPMFPFEI